jgi:hypothetical protein
VAAARTIIVAGAGIGGLTAALSLAAKGFRVVILEKAERLEEAGAGLQLSPNASRILVDLEGIRLHSFWDQLLGRSANPHTAYNEAIRMEADFPRKSLHELSKARTPLKWSLECRSLAVEKVYLGGKLAGSPTPETAPALPEDYAKSAKAVAERRAALAAARLADEIRKYLK